jgi:hypothetical protein
MTGANAERKPLPGIALAAIIVGWLLLTAFGVVMTYRVWTTKASTGTSPSGRPSGRRSFYSVPWWAFRSWSESSGSSGRREMSSSNRCEPVVSAEAQGGPGSCPGCWRSTLGLGRRGRPIWSTDVPVPGLADVRPKDLRVVGARRRRVAGGQETPVSGGIGPPVLPDERVRPPLHLEHLHGASRLAGVLGRRDVPEPECLVHRASRADCEAHRRGKARGMSEAYGPAIGQQRE